MSFTGKKVSLKFRPTKIKLTRRLSIFLRMNLKCFLSNMAIVLSVKLKMELSFAVEFQLMIRKMLTVIRENLKTFLKVIPMIFKTPISSLNCLAYLEFSQIKNTIRVEFKFLNASVKSFMNSLLNRLKIFQI